TVWIGMLRHPEFDSFDLSHLKKCYYGASIMPVEIIKEILERLPGVGIYNSYGQTELSPCHTFLKAEDALKKLGSAGVGALHMETRIEDESGKEITQPGVAGEICGRGPHVMALYFKDPEKTEACMENGWFHSGDLGHLDGDRYVFVVDRKKDMIKTGGENVASREVEEAIYTNPGVEEVAVVGLDHPKWVEAVTAVVVPRKGETLIEDDILATCQNAQLARFKIPKKVVVVEALPKSPTGKILKRRIRETYKNAFC
ncbi:MAG: AMP-binding protein, partial [Desulfobacterales bacterium]|nr:AMP-binding protein [Desulfobacterales bacterium]